MEEKRIRVTFDRKGNVKFTTVSGFAGENCNETAEKILQVINGECVKAGKTDDADRVPDELQYIVD